MDKAKGKKIDACIRDTVNRLDSLNSQITLMIRERDTLIKVIESLEIIKKDDSLE